MARAPETGFYFEPMTERLALIVEGSPYPSDDPWAHVGDPAEMSPEQARLEVATRWPDVDPDTLDVEFDTNFARAAAEIERLRREESEQEPGSGEIPFDVELLLQQADALKAAAAQLALPREAAPQLDAGETVGESIARAHPPKIGSTGTDRGEAGRAATSPRPPEET